MKTKKKKPVGEKKPKGLKALLKMGYKPKEYDKGCSHDCHTEYLHKGCEEGCQLSHCMKCYDKNCLPPVSSKCECGNTPQDYKIFPKPCKVHPVVFVKHEPSECAPESWEDRFDKKFRKHKLFGRGAFGFELDDIKSFIRSLLASQKREINKQVEEAMDDWRYEGRSKEQLWALDNFRTGTFAKLKKKLLKT